MKCPTASLALAPDLLIVVNTSLYPQIMSDLDGYIKDLEDEGHTPSVVTCDDVQSPEACDSLKSLLATQYAQGLQGAVFIGDLPIAWYHMLDDFNGDSIFEDYEEFPCDLYYMDLDGEWLDTLRWNGFSFEPGSDSIFDVHRGEVMPEIWVGRLMPSPIGDEDSLMHNYFVKDSIYRDGGFGLPKRALAFVDDDWVWWAGEWSANIGLAYSEVMTVADSESTIADNYRTRLGQGYEWISVFAHSWPGGHGFKYNVSDWTWFYSYEVPVIDPQANFYNLFACSNARYIETENMGGMNIFSPTYGLGALGTTKTGSMLNFDEFYYPLGKGATLGEAFRDWFITRGLDGYQTSEMSWFYGMALLGDPTLRVVPLTGLEVRAERPSPSSMSLAALPNPFLGSTTITARVQDARDGCSVKIYDAAGRAVRSFAFGSGETDLVWDGMGERGEELPVGLYICVLAAGGETTASKIVMLR